MRGINSPVSLSDEQFARINRLQAEHRAYLDSLPPAREKTEDELAREQRDRVLRELSLLSDFYRLETVVTLALGEVPSEVEQIRQNLANVAMLVRQVRDSDTKKARAQCQDELQVTDAAHRIAIARMQATTADDPRFIERRTRDAEIQRVTALAIERVDEWAPGLREFRVNQARATHEFMVAAITPGRVDISGNTIVNGRGPFTPGQVISPTSIVPVDRLLDFIRSLPGHEDAPARQPNPRRNASGVWLGGRDGDGVFEVASADGILP
jgi:hypothetical protein